MLNYLDLLLGWAASWNDAGRPTPSVEAHLGGLDVEKRSAWLVVEGDDVSGQLTVWESGECELEAYRNSDGMVVLLEHRDLSTAEDFRSACRMFVAVCGRVAE